MTTAFHRIFAGIASAIVLIALVWGFLIAGSPTTGRQQRLDERRLQDLRTIQSEITNIVYDGQPWQGTEAPLPKNPLPTTLDEVQAKAIYQRPSITDPESGLPYGYDVKSATTYELCATFTNARDVSYDVRWNHPAGEHCYDFDVTQQGEPKPIPTEVIPVEPEPRAMTKP